MLRSTAPCSLRPLTSSHVPERLRREAAAHAVHDQRLVRLVPADDRDSGGHLVVDVVGHQVSVDIDHACSAGSFSFVRLFVAGFVVDGYGIATLANPFDHEAFASDDGVGTPEYVAGGVRGKDDDTVLVRSSDVAGVDDVTVDRDRSLTEAIPTRPRTDATTVPRV